MSTTLALALVYVSLFVFLHHVANLIQPSTFVQGGHRSSLRTIQKLECARDSEATETEKDADSPPFPEREPITQRYRQSGYVQHVQLGAIIAALDGSREASTTGDAFMDIPFGLGLSVSAGIPIVRLWPEEDSEPGYRLKTKAHGSLVLGKERSFQQGFAFGPRQLSDIALLSLLPHVNAPLSAVQVVDRIEASRISLGDYGTGGVLGLGLDRIRSSAFTSGHVTVLDRLLEIVDRAFGNNTYPNRRNSLWERALAVARPASKEITDPRDVAGLVLRAGSIGASMLQSGLRGKVSSDLRDSHASARICQVTKTCRER